LNASEPFDGDRFARRRQSEGLVLSLLAKIDDLVEQNKALLARIAELEGRAGKPPKTPTNSSLPPSSGQKAVLSRKRLASAF
jgi:hypothetical protein